MSSQVPSPNEGAPSWRSIAAELAADRSTNRRLKKSTAYQRFSQLHESVPQGPCDPVQLKIHCGVGHHQLVLGPIFELKDHDEDAETVAEALGGDTPACVLIARAWSAFVGGAPVPTGVAADHLLQDLMERNFELVIHRWLEWRATRASTPAQVDAKQRQLIAALQTQIAQRSQDLQRLQARSFTAAPKKVFAQRQLAKSEAQRRRTIEKSVKLRTREYMEGAEAAYALALILHLPQDAWRLALTLRRR
ncbi:MAG TPA: hypothetical protein VNE62_07090 [Actinomycetota bacterium]|nr:hypothetical protein [Actinomycetota bacterium]